MPEVRLIPFKPIDPQALALAKRAVIMHRMLPTQLQGVLVHEQNHPASVALAHVAIPLLAPLVDAYAGLYMRLTILQEMVAMAELYPEPEGERGAWALIYAELHKQDLNPGRYDPEPEDAQEKKPALALVDDAYIGEQEALEGEEGDEQVAAIKALRAEGERLHKLGLVRPGQ